MDFNPNVTKGAPAPASYVDATGARFWGYSKAPQLGGACGRGPYSPSCFCRASRRSARMSLSPPFAFVHAFRSASILNS